MVQMSPLEGSLTGKQASQVRDVVELLLLDFLEAYEWDVSFTSNIEVATVSLTAVDHVEYVPLNNQVAVSFGGLVYFKYGSIGVPSPDTLTQLIVEGFNQQDGSLLPALQAIFPNLSDTTLGFLNIEDEDDLTDEAPTVAPTPTPDVTIKTGVQSGLNGDGENGEQNIGAVAGSIAGGFAIVLLGVMFLFVSRRKRVVSSLDEEHDLQLEPHLDLEKEGGVHASIQPARSLDNTLDDDAEQAPSSRKQEKHVTTSSNKSAPVSFPPREEPPPPPPSRFSQMFAAAASFPRRMLMAPSAQTQPKRMPDDHDDDMASDFDMESFSDFSSSVVIQPQIMPVESMESFEHQRRHMVLKKDMMMSREDIPDWKRPQNTTDNFNYDNNCALKPTDHSAATLAIATTTTSGPSSPPSRQSSNFLRSCSLTPKFPRISWMRDHPKKQPNSGYNSSDADDNNTFGSNLDEDNLWDPDDASVGYAASDASTSDVFTPAIIENRDDKSQLLQHHHSFQRNESYKLQRLRTPTGEGVPSRGSRPAVPKSPFMRGESIEVNQSSGSSDLVIV